MKLKINRDKLLNGVSVVTIPHSLSSFSHGNIIQLKADDKLSLLNSDGIVQVVSKLDADIESCGECGVSCSNLSKVLRLMPKGDISLLLEGSYLRVESQRKIARLETVSSEFLFSEPTFSPLFSISGEWLRKTISLHLPIISSSRFDFLYCEEKDGKLYIVSTDGRRILFTRIDIEATFDKFLIPPSLHPLLQIAKDDIVEVGLDGQQIFFKNKDNLLVSRLLDREMFDPWGVLSKILEPDGTEFIVRLRDLCDLLMFGSLSEMAPVVNLELNGSIIKLENSTPSIGKIEDEVEVEVINNRGNLGISLNAKLVLDVLKKLGDVDVIVKLISTSDPITLMPIESELDFIFSVMPIKR